MSKSKSKTAKEQMFLIFNNIQTRTETKDNLEAFYALFESAPIADFNEALESIVLIIFFNYDKNNLPLKNIKEFLKLFLEKALRNQKLKEKLRAFLKHFCNLLTLNAKKLKYKNLSLYFLSIFLIPYSNGNILLYDSSTLEDIKNYLLIILRGKQSALHMGVLHLLEKHPSLQKDTDIWERLEVLLSGDNKNIKRAIIKLFENCNENISKYLLEMYDDESAEIRAFAFEKLAKIKDYHAIDSKTKVKLFFVGLSDSSQKVQAGGKKLLKNYLNYLGILKRKNANDNNSNVIDPDKMDVDEDMNASNINKRNNNINDNDDDDDDNDDDQLRNNNRTSTAKENIQRTTTPMKPIGKKLNDSPSRIFDELDVISNYNHPKYSYVFTLITEAMLEIIDKEDLLDYLKDIIENLSSITTRINEIKQFSTEKKRLSQFSSSRKERLDKYALFNDVYFLQSKSILLLIIIIDCLTILSQEKSTEGMKSSVIDTLPDGRTFSKILAHFYISSPNIFILHQLLLIAQFMPFQDELGNREMNEFIKQFISDLSLQTKKVKDFSFRRLAFNRMDTKPDDFDNEFYNNSNKELSEEKKNEMCLNNILLPLHRRIILSMEDLVELNLEILKLINNGKDNLLFLDIMGVINELKEHIDIDSDNSLKNKQKELLNQFKEKVSLIEALDEKKKSDRDKLQTQKDIIAARKELTVIDNELFEVTQQEGRILYRIIKLCEFTVNHCHLPQSSFDTMTTSLIIPTLKRTQFPSVVHTSLQITGLLAINHFNSPYRNFLKLFFDNLFKDNHDEFKDSNRIALSIIFDSMLQNNLLLLPQEIMNGTIDDKIKLIISKYLYHSSYTPRVIVFMGLCKLLLADRVTKHEFLLSRLFVTLYRSFEIIDTQSEEYNIKIYEIMNNFMYFYSLSGKSHVNAIIKAIKVILTTQLLFSNDNSYDKSVMSDYGDTKIDFLNQFLYIVYQNAKDKLKLDFMHLVFKIFKYLCFVYKYAKCDDKEYEKNANIGVSTLNQINNKIAKLFEKTRYDQGLYSFFTENDLFMKFYSFLFVLNEDKLLSSFSSYLSDEFKGLKESKGNVIEINSITYDLNSEEKQKEMKDYVNKKQKKYYEVIEEYHLFGLQLKENKLKNIFKENSKILEVEENDSEDNGNDNEESKQEKKKKGRKPKKFKENIKPEKRKNSPKKKKSKRYS